MRNVQIKRAAKQMGHNHTHSHSHSHSHGGNAEKNILVAFFLNAFFVIVEVVGGLLTNSIAILTDALHDFGDCLSLATSWYFQKKSGKKRDKFYSYGYKRFSLLGSIFLSGVLCVSSVVVVIEAVKRIANPEPVDAGGMFWIALFGIVINGAAALRVKRGSSINERAVYLHIMEDVLGWFAVLTVSIVMYFVYLPVLDPLLSVGISVWVMINIYKNLKAAFKVMLQAVPEDVDAQKLKDDITGIAGVMSVHDLHLWSLDGESHVMTVHVVIGDDSQPMTVKQSIYLIANRYSIVHSTIEIEKEGCGCIMNCDDV